MEKKFVISLQPDTIKDKFHYPLLSYKVEIYGSWNDWTIGHLAKMEYKKARNENNKREQLAKYYAKIKLDKGIYEYKWKFSYYEINDPLKTHTIWLNDTTGTITNNEEWNQNNLFEYK